jgi:hypothetical protein
MVNVPLTMAPRPRCAFAELVGRALGVGATLRRSRT